MLHLINSKYLLPTVLAAYLIILFVVFKKIGKLSFFFLALIIAIKIIFIQSRNHILKKIKNFIN